MKNRFLLFLLFAPLILAGCGAKYDIDVQCWKDIATDNPLSDPFQDKFAGETEGVKTMACSMPKYFMIQCEAKTVQEFGDVITCSTFDHQKTRITLIDRPQQ